MAGQGDGFGAVGRAQLAHNGADMKLDRALGDDQAISNLFVG